MHLYVHTKYVYIFTIVRTRTYVRPYTYRLFVKEKGGKAGCRLIDTCIGVRVERSDHSSLLHRGWLPERHVAWQVSSRAPKACRGMSKTVLISFIPFLENVFDLFQAKLVLPVGLLYGRWVALFDS